MANNEWKFNCWTGNNILDVPELCGRIVRQAWGADEYRYDAEYWGDYSLKFPVSEYRFTTLQEAKKALAKLHKKYNVEVHCGA
jgi:hypothetical protein